MAGDPSTFSGNAKQGLAAVVLDAGMLGSLQVGWGLAWVSGVGVALLIVAQSEILDDLVVVGVQPGR